MNQITNNDAIYHSTYEDYGKGWLTKDEKTFEQLGEDKFQLDYLEKYYKGTKISEKMAKQPIVNSNNEKYNYDKNVKISKSNPFNQNEFKSSNSVKSPDIITNNEKYKYDKNAIISKPFPFKASQFKYPNDGQEKPKSLYITTNDTYGKIKPSDLELPEKYFPKNTNFTKKQGFLMYTNNSLNCSNSNSPFDYSIV